MTKRRFGYVYLFHFDSPVSPNSRTQHYMGATRDFDDRMQAHIQGRGRGSRLIQVALERGIGVRLVRRWKTSVYGVWQLERKLKGKGRAGRTTKVGLSKYCPICHPELYRYRCRTVVEVGEEVA